jgi:hypothetical protein
MGNKLHSARSRFDFRVLFPKDNPLMGKHTSAADMIKSKRFDLNVFDASSLQLYTDHVDRVERTFPNLGGEDLKLAVDAAIEVLKLGAHNSRYKHKSIGTPRHSAENPVKRLISGETINQQKLVEIEKTLKRTDLPQAILSEVKPKYSGNLPESSFNDCFLTSLRNLDCNFSSL